MQDPNAKPRKTMHMIGNAHLDPVWLWDWREGYAENIATMQSMLDRLKEYPDILFTSSSAQFYEWIAEHSPAMFKKIRDQVAEGRWEICGGWWVQPDCNIPSGESFARHTLIAQNFFQRNFGMICSTGYCVDSFGHCGTLPQILQLSRMTRYVFMRPNQKEKPIVENLFIWESPDGSKVTAYRIPFSYCAYGGLEEIIEQCTGEFPDDLSHMMCFYGVGNHGGGPTIKNIQTILRKRIQHPDILIEFSSIERFFQEVEVSGCTLDTVKEDLQHHASGCYSVLSEVKRENRRAENALIRAEKVCVLSEYLRQTPYPNERLSDGWKNILFNQFHDILAGTSIQSAYIDVGDQVGEACSISSRAENRALQRISNAIAIPSIPASVPIVIFNLHGWRTRSPIEIEWGQFLNTLLPKRFLLKGPDGVRVPFQTIEASVECRNRTRVLFLADIEAFGYGLYTILETDEIEEFDNPLDSLALDNDILRVEFSQKTGGISQITGLATGLSFLRGDGAVGAVFEDTSDTWGHATLSFNRFVGSFSPVSIEKTEYGPVRQTMRVVSVFGNSTMIQEFSLYSERDEISVKVTVNWQEQLKGLKLCFPIAVVEPVATYEVPFGSSVKAPDGVEEPMQNWFDASGADGIGISILNDGKYSAAVDGNTMGFTVLRSPSYSHHIPASLSKSQDHYRFIDQGFQEFNYVIVPHERTWQDAGIPRRAFELNQKPVVVIETYHEGTLPASWSLLEVSCRHVVTSCLKKADDIQGYIMRLFETDGIACEADVKIHATDKHWKISFRPYEIKTIRFDFQFNFIEEVDFLEWRKDGGV
jgi:alpha-mannosidase